MRTFWLSLLAVLVLTGGVVTSARAGNLDPRKCPFSTSKSYCAGFNAKITARKWLARKAGTAELLWQGPVNCAVVKPILIWRCSYSPTIPTVGSGNIRVTFRATSTGWHTYVTVD